MAFQPEPPSSILVIGAGVFGLSTFYTLLSSPRYDDTKLYLVDAYVPPPSASSSNLQRSLDPNPPITASIDSSRIIRADYPERAYSQLAVEAIEKWRAGWPWLNVGKSRKVHYGTGFMLTATTYGASQEEVEKGRRYVRKSLENVKALKEHNQEGKSTLEVLGSGVEVKRRWREMGDEKWEDAKEGGDEWIWGEGGYMNKGSGWADAAGAMENLREVVAETIDRRRKEGRKGAVRWMQGKVESLLFSELDESEERRVLGARLEDGEGIIASLTVLASGAWSASLMPKELGPRLRATGQVLGYIKLGPDEARFYRGKPVLMDMTTSLFFMPPPPVDVSIAGDLDNHKEVILKVARHGYGYENSVKIRDPMCGESFEVFLPPPDLQSLPPEGDRALRGFLQAAFPSLGSRPWYQTRICNYSDTPSGNFIISYVPGYKSSVFVASGGSGHGFKFVPIIGEKVVAVMEGHGGWSENEARLVKLWAWPEYEDFDKAWAEGSDGSRGGRRGMRWKDEMEQGE